MNKEVDEIVDVASRHYGEIVKGDWDGWVGTLAPRLQRTADVRGSSADFWWRAGRRMAEKGVTYEFHHVDYIEDERAKLFFKRIDKDGRQLGLPVPIYLVKVEGKWWVDQPTY